MLTKMQQELLSEITMEDLPERSRDIAEIIGIESYARLSDYAKGDKIYFPKVEAIVMPARNRRIQKEYNGYNQKELAERYDITIQQVNNILKNRPSYRQISLFEYLS